MPANMRRTHSWLVRTAHEKKHGARKQRTTWLCPLQATIAGGISSKEKLCTIYLSLKKHKHVSVQLLRKSQPAHQAMGCSQAFGGWQNHPKVKKKGHSLTLSTHSRSTSNRNNRARMAASTLRRKTAGLAHAHNTEKTLSASK
jgi:hypothetical protein